ncbi:hypothetical protein GCK32_012140, partial [Trichostrongylus colubriformis]
SPMRSSWVGYEGFDPAELKWLNLPFSSAHNGWSIAVNCVAYYNMNSYPNNYLFFYPCSSLYYSICERNYTITNLF